MKSTVLALVAALTACATTAQATPRGSASTMTSPNAISPRSLNRSHRSNEQQEACAALGRSGRRAERCIHGVCSFAGVRAADNPRSDSQPAVTGLAAAG